ncbi:MAG: AAA family ATPase, partial [Deltaproteobacteria bacterium]|nr:AAA family ATPase [Deltaproteobacteria bacterium]
GHVYYPYEPLLDECREILQVERDIIVNALAGIALEKKIVIEDLNENPDAYKENNKAVFLSKFHVCETNISFRIKRLVSSPKTIRSVDAEKAVTWVQEKLDISLAEKQAQAVHSAITHKMLVITGGPGTGKTTIIHAILEIFSRMGIRILLAAPTGRAAKRMQEATGHEAKTIHRLLAYSFADNGFKHNDKNPLDGDLLIVDEASMIDTVLMHHLLKSVPVG